MIGMLSYPSFSVQIGTLNGASFRTLPLGFPRGEAAERSEADEGWRVLKVSDFPVEWRKPEHMPLIQLHL